MSNDGQGQLIPSFARDVIDVSVSEELGQSFLAYSLSVITSRAIPDIKDGLKPVQRRILYSMGQMNLRPDRPHRKCAHVVGDVMAKYHPHGDSAIYDALVRLGQDFTRNVTLIDPQGNFGSLDDPPAAYRYTEARLTDAALDMLGEIEEDTVEFRATYDGEGSEPAYLPSVLPNLLVNGTSGIAVGMATNMPTHNLVEVFEAIKLVMSKRRPKPTTEELMALVPGPDFPSGGLVIDEDLTQIYETGRGSIRMRATMATVNVTRARKGLEVTELPYLVGPERVMAKIKDLINAGRISGISDVKNLSDRHSGTRLLIEAKTGVDMVRLAEDLYRLTPLEETFGVNNVVLIDGVPTSVGLYELCHHYIEHRLDVVVRRSQFRLRKATERIHIVEGLLIAIDNIDTVVSIIRTSADTAEARARLMETLGLTEIQANWILELRLRRLTALAYDELVEERTELTSTIEDLEKILASEQRQRTIVIKELGELVKRHGRPRRTKIISPSTIPTPEELAVAEAEAKAAVEEPCVISLATSGTIGRDPQGSSRSYTPGRHDVIQSSLLTTTTTSLMAITDAGRVLRRDALDVAEVGGRSRGSQAAEVFGAERGESILAVFGPEGAPLTLVTAAGQAKRLTRQTLLDTRAERPVMGLADRDRVVAAFEALDDDELVLVASDAQALRTPNGKIATQGASAKGVAGIGLRGNARVIAAGTAGPDNVIIAVSNLGTVKATDVAEIPSKGRGTGGVRLAKFGDEDRFVYAWLGVPDRLVAIVAADDSSSKPAAAPESIAIRPTRRDGPCVSHSHRILNLGSLRW